MIQRFLAAVAVLSLCVGAGAAQEKAKLPNRPGPFFFTVIEMGKDDVVLTAVGARNGELAPFSSYKPALKDIDIFDARGNELSVDDFRKRTKVGTVVLVAADEHRVHPAYLSVLKDDAVVLVGVVVRVEIEPLRPNK